jgi:23S rRNA G2445 N2-methylase RlmL
LFATADDDLARQVERALARAGKPALAAAITRFDGAVAPERGRLCALVGQFASVDGNQVTEWLLARLTDADPKTRRRAIAALGKLEPGSQEAPLLESLRQASDPADTRALVFSLGNVGSRPSLDALAALPAPSTAGEEFARLVREATRKITARLSRLSGDGEASLDPSQALSVPTDVLLHVRAGLESILLEELGSRGEPRVAGRGRVQVRHEGPLDALFRARTFLHLGVPLMPEPVHGDDVVGAVVRALTSDSAWATFRALSQGPVRYRLEWAEGGRSRARTARVADAVAALRPELHNDSRGAPWEVVISERSGNDGGRVFVELWPKLSDPRFAYRRRVLPASSHPTIGAALARVAAVTASDVVWDPFVGSGIELCECARLAPRASLHGTDLDAVALGAARENLSSVGAARYELRQGDARHVPLPQGLSVVVTNPPFGRRVLDRDAILPLLSEVLRRVADELGESGRLVWISPLADETAAAAKRLGLRAVSRSMVDVGGLRGELQHFAGRKRTPRDSERR